MISAMNELVIASLHSLKKEEKKLIISLKNALFNYIHMNESLRE